MSDEYKVEYLRASRVVNDERQYLVHWKGWDADSETWEPESALENCAEAIKAFWESTRNRDKIKPVRKVRIIGAKLRQGTLVYSVAFAEDSQAQLVTTKYLKKYYHQVPEEVLPA